MLSIVVPSYNEEANVGVLYEKISEVLENEDFEIIYVNDGSGDETLEILKQLAAKHSNVQYLSFSRNFGHQAALRAGLAYARGEAVISMDADLQHPPKLLHKLISKWRSGYEIVYTIRQDTNETPLVKRLTSSLFYKGMNFLSDMKIDQGAADFRLLDRKVVDVINAQKETNLFLRGYIDWIGFRRIGIAYTPAKRFSGKSKYTFKKMLKLAGDGVTQFSIRPLRLAFLLSWFAFGFAAVYVLYAIVAASFGRVVPGWLSIVVLLVFLQGLQFMLIGLIGEYLGRTFMQTKGRPEYIVAESSIKDDD